MKPPVFTYHNPGSLGEAVELMASLETAQPLAGGQSLMPMLNFRLVRPDHVIDLNRIAELSGIRIEGGRVTIGAMTRQADIERSAQIAQHCPLMLEAILNVGHRQTRNRGTIGGSLAHMDPAAELPIVALALGATLRAQSRSGIRTIGMDKFALSTMTTALRPGELLVELSFDASAPGQGWAFEEFSRRHGDFAVVAVAVLLQLEAGMVRHASVAIGGVGPVPVRLAEVERALDGKPASEALVAEAARLAGRIEAQSDLHASGKYRQRLAAVLAERAIKRALARAAPKEAKH